MDLFEHQWPSDLPRHCPHCKSPFITSRHLAIGPGRASRFFRACAYWSMIPWVFLAWIILGTIGPNQLTLALFCFVPLIVFMPFAILMPDSRRVRCSHCGYDHDFPARKRRHPRVHP